MTKTPNVCGRLFNTIYLYTTRTGVSSARAVVKADLHSTTIAIDTNGIVADAVKMADELMEKLYPIKEEESK